MRALPVPRDTVDLLVTAALISSTDITQSPARLPIITPGQSPEAVLAGADRIGQQLWDENYASVSFANGCSVIAPRYEWRPVAELMGDRVDVEQILQIERNRLYMEEVSCHHNGWDDSPARNHLRRLGQSIEARLYFHPRDVSPELPGVVEYVGLSRAVDEWTREVGFRTSLAVEAARNPQDVGDR